jgi:hypothetical protein
LLVARERELGLELGEPRAGVLAARVDRVEHVGLLLGRQIAEQVLRGAVGLVVRAGAGRVPRGERR